MQRTNRYPLTLLFVVGLAGFTFLVLEVSWQRSLALVLGATVTASTIVLAAYMAGLGAGAWIWGRTTGGYDRTARMLSGLLAGVAALAALGYLAVTLALPAVYRSLAASGVGPPLADAIAYAIAAVVVLGPAFLIGGVLPLASRLAVAASGAIGASLGRLYAVETLGSALGGLTAGFLLLGTLGQGGTVAVAVVIDLALAAWLFAAHRGGRAEPAPASAPAEKTAAGRRSGRAEPADPAAGRRAALVGTFVCGFCILALQVVWFRIFRIYLTNTSYTFALVSSLVILGAFAGSALYARHAASSPDRLRSFQRALALLAATTGLGFALLVELPRVLLFPFESALADPLLRVLGIPLVASLLIVLPPAACSGYAFPLACRLATRGRSTIASDVGLTLMVNTAGSVVGPLLAAFVLLPGLGAVRSGLVVLALVLSAVIFVQAKRGGGAAARYALGGGAAVLLVFVALRPPVQVLPPSFVRYDREVLFYRESVEGTLSVAHDRGALGCTKYTFVNNSAVIGSSYDAIKVVKMVGHLPFLLGNDAKNILVIGFGIGVTTSAIAAHPGVESIECVELVEGLVDAAVYYRDLNHDVARDPRLRVIAGDGRHHLQRTARTYDLISCDPTHPILGSGNLYTTDYFELCRAHLAPGGMVSQYLPLHKLGTAEFLGLLRTFQSVFPHCAVWLGHYHAVLIGALAPLQVDFADWAAAVAALGQDRHFYLEPYHLAATLMLSGDAVAALGARSALNTDDCSYTEFFAPRCLDADNLARNLRFLADARVDPGAVFADVPDPERLARAVQGNRLLCESLVAKLSGDDARGLRFLQQACAADPDDQELPFLVKLYY